MQKASPAPYSPALAKGDGPGAMRFLIKGPLVVPFWSFVGSRACRESHLFE